MRKHRKLAAVLSTTAVLTAFAPLFTTPVLAQSAGWSRKMRTGATTIPTATN